MHLRPGLVADATVYRQCKQFRPPKARCSFSTSPRRTQEIRDAYILSAARTPTGKFGGKLSKLNAVALGAQAIKAAVAKSNVPQAAIGTVFMGNVLSAGLGQSPARQAALFSGLQRSTDAVTVNKVCASGLKAVVLGAQNIQLGIDEAVVAGGMENMSCVPFYFPRAIKPPMYGDPLVHDGIKRDGLTDIFVEKPMGWCTEQTVKEYNISREQQDAYAIESFKRAQAAWAAGKFLDEVVGVECRPGGGPNGFVEEDENVKALKEDKVPSLSPAFIADGTLTAGNSSPLSDGASALVLANRETAEKHDRGRRVLARFVSSADAAVAPTYFSVAPAKAVPIALERAGISKDDVAVWEFNEAFAAVVLANQKILGLEGARVNPLGGAIALGHALGSSGSRILTTLLHQLKPGEYGVAAICNGGGAATAVVVQRIKHL